MLCKYIPCFLHVNETLFQQIWKVTYLNGRTILYICNLSHTIEPYIIFLVITRQTKRYKGFVFFVFISCKTKFKCWVWWHEIGLELKTVIYIVPYKQTKSWKCLEKQTESEGLSWKLMMKEYCVWYHIIVTSYQENPETW